MKNRLYKKTQLMIYKYLNVLWQLKIPVMLHQEYLTKANDQLLKQAYVNNVYEKCLILLIENGCLPLYTILKDKKFMLKDMTERLKFLLETLRSRQTNSQAM